MLLRELQNMNGTYAAVRFSPTTIASIKEYIHTHNIPNAIRSSKLHSTLIYSRKHLPNFKGIGTYATPLIGIPTKLTVWKTRPEDGSEPANCLVLLYDCPKLSERHKTIIDTEKGSHDFDKYEPHITLSYSIGEVDIDKLPKFEDNIEIVSEYHEDLDLKWSKTQGSN